MQNMTNETRDEIVRLARTSADARTILARLTGQDQNEFADGSALTEEAVQRVLDETDAEIDRMLTPTVPSQPGDAIGRIAKWLDEVIVGGYDLRDIAQMLVECTQRTRKGACRRANRDKIAGRLADQLDKMATETGEDK